MKEAMGFFNTDFKSRTLDTLSPSIIFDSDLLLAGSVRFHTSRSFLENVSFHIFLKYLITYELCTQNSLHLVILSDVRNASERPKFATIVTNHVFQTSFIFHSRILSRTQTS